MKHELSRGAVDNFKYLRIFQLGTGQEKGLAGPAIALNGGVLRGVLWYGGSVLVMFFSKVVVFFLCLSPFHALFAQERALSTADARFVFETASIHPDDPHVMYGATRISFESDRYEASHVDLRTLVEEAYGIDDSQIQHAPGLLDSPSFTITATIDQELLQVMDHMSAEDRKMAQQAMLQRLLADRFQLVARAETKEQPVYSLEPAREGAHLRAGSEGNYEHGEQWGDGRPMGPHVVSWYFRVGQVRMVGQSASMDQLIERLAQKITPQLGRKIINRTGLMGDYDFDLTFRMPWPPNGSLFPDSAADESTSSDNLFAALRKQLGLQLKSSTGPVRVITIERLELPSEN
jgi:bla regulator protein blaR1